MRCIIKYLINDIFVSSPPNNTVREAPAPPVRLAAAAAPQEHHLPERPRRRHQGAAGQEGHVHVSAQS